MQQNLWVVITGNIRDELDFKLTLTKLIELRNKGKVQHILLSTWKGEIDRYSDLRKKLKILQIYILEISKLSEKMEGIPSGSINYWRQAKQLLRALDFIPKNDFVLRVRTDRSLNYINRIDKLGIFENYKIPVKEIGKFTKIFRYQIIVFRPRMIRLFQMTDFLILGRNKDLYKLINFEIYELNFQKRIVANAQWFANPFIKEFPILRDYISFTLYSNATYILKKYVDKNRELSKFPEVYYKVYALYFLILYSHFHILDLEKFDENNRDNIEFYHFFSNSPNKSLRYQSLGTIIVDQEVIKMAIFGQLKKSFAYEKLLHYINLIIALGETSGIYELSATDYEQILAMVENNFYDAPEDKKWFKKLVRPPLDQSKFYKYNKISNTFLLNCLDICNDDWRTLSYTNNIEKDLYKLWSDINTPNLLLSEKMLLPVARTGNKYAIYILIDLLYHGLLSKNIINELIRIALFYLDIDVKSKNTSLISSIIIIRLIAIQYNKLVSFDISDRFLKFCLEYIFNENLTLSFLSDDKGKYLNNIVINLNYSLLDFHIMELIKSIINDSCIDSDIKDIFKNNELLIVEQRWLRFLDKE